MPFRSAVFSTVFSTGDLFEAAIWPKRWRILADVLYDLGTGLEVLSPLCPHLFFQVAGLGNFAKGMAMVAARATRLPIYCSFAKESNLSDLFAKGEAISTVFNIARIGAEIQ